MEKLLLFHPEMISTNFLWGNVFLRETLLTDVKNSNLKKFCERRLFEIWKYTFNIKRWACADWLCLILHDVYSVWYDKDAWV